MSLTLVSTPDYLDDMGNTINIFPGFKPIEFAFKREDIQIISVGSGVDTQAEITVLGDLTSVLSEGDYIYLYSEGTTFTYDISSAIVSIIYSAPNSTILIEFGYIESTTSGYMNYLKNWYIEAELVNPVNTSINLLGYNLKDDGSPDGNVSIDTSIINDKNTQDYPATSSVLEEGRTKYKVQYKEVYTGSSNPFTLIALEYIAIFATVDFKVDTLLDTRIDPKIYRNYPFGGGVIHTDYNEPDKVVKFSFDELDVNGEYLSDENTLKVFAQGDYGLLFVNSQDYGSPTNAFTYYVNVEVELIDVGEYDASEYDPTEYST